MKLLIRPFTLILVTAVLLSLGCPGIKIDDDDSGGEDGTPSATPAMSALSIEFSDLTFTHTYSVSPCPTLIGTVTLTNSTDAAATFDLSDSGSLVTFSMASGTIAVGESVTVEIQFNCANCPAAGFTSTVTANIGNGTKSNQQTATVTGNFVDCP